MAATATAMKASAPRMAGDNRHRLARAVAAIAPSALRGRPAAVVQGVDEGQFLVQVDDLVLGEFRPAEQPQFFPQQGIGRHRALAQDDEGAQGDGGDHDGEAEQDDHSLPRMTIEQEPAGAVGAEHARPPR